MAKNQKKNQKKKPKKTNANLEILKNQKNQCQFTDFGVATGFFWFFLGEHPPNHTEILGNYLVFQYDYDVVHRNVISF